MDKSIKKLLSPIVQAYIFRRNGLSTKVSAIVEPPTVDTIESFVPCVEIRAVKALPESLPIFQVHFPGQPIYPGVLQLQAILDCAVVLVENSTSRADSSRHALTSTLKEVSFRKIVYPMDTLNILVKAADPLDFGRNTDAGDTSKLFEMKGEGAISRD